MRTYLISYFASLVTFLAMDFCWISLTVKPIYKARLGSLLLDQPHFGIAAFFYAMYAVGIVVFAVMPALDQQNYFRAWWAGALLGLMAYGAYDLTNQATIQGWSSVVTLFDLVWGTIATAAGRDGSFFYNALFYRSLDQLPPYPKRCLFCGNEETFLTMQRAGEKQCHKINKHKR